MKLVRICLYQFQEICRCPDPENHECFRPIEIMKMQEEFNAGYRPPINPQVAKFYERYGQEWRLRI